MKIGLLAYHSACNFGATLQLLSTYGYLLKHGHQPVVINWTPISLERYYRERVPLSQFQEHLDSRRRLWKETRLCRNSEDVANAIKQEGIESVIIGSDAVAQHHPWLERVVFPCRTVIGVEKNTEDREFPNPFWAVWNDMLDTKVPVAAISVSNQDSKFHLISKQLREEMGGCVMQYSYISVRDTWTQKMMAFLTHDTLHPDITPDPVFALNENAGEWIPSKREILNKFQLPEQYILMTFPTDRKTVSQAWLDEFQKLADADGKKCVLLPFSHADSFGILPHAVKLPLSPTDWYALIKYSSGYVGHNMHPIVVSLHNQVPFFCFDTYGTKHLNGLLTDDRSSKIRHILKKAGFEDNRISCLSRQFRAPQPSDVYHKICNFDKIKAADFADQYVQSYRSMMNDVLKSISR